MAAILIDGKEIASRIKKQLKKQVSAMRTKPCLAVILVGDDFGSKVYINMKKISCDEAGIKARICHLPVETLEQELLQIIQRCNDDAAVHGILVQLPLPNHIREEVILKAVSSIKDVDGFHPINVGLLQSTNFTSGKKAFIPCTPKGIIRMIKESGITIDGKTAVVIGRSNIVGKPVAQLLLQENATVTICHSKTKNLADHTKTADIVIVAVGKPLILRKDMIKNGCVIIDVGVNRIEDKKEKKGYRVCGDVDFDDVQHTAGYISPVPGGVGPMTIAMLMENVLLAKQFQEESEESNGSK